MRKPDDWYGFTAFCDLYEGGQSNMTAPSKQQYCLRKDRNGSKLVTDKAGRFLK